jgi:hypothetical protein
VLKLDTLGPSTTDKRRERYRVTDEIRVLNDAVPVVIFTDARGFRWRRIGKAQPEQMVDIGEREAVDRPTYDLEACR